MENLTTWRNVVERKKMFQSWYKAEKKSSHTELKRKNCNSKLRDHAVTCCALFWRAAYTQFGSGGKRVSGNYPTRKKGGDAQRGKSGRCGKTRAALILTLPLPPCTYPPLPVQQRKPTSVRWGKWRNSVGKKKYSAQHTKASPWLIKGSKHGKDGRKACFSPV